VTKRIPKSLLSLWLVGYLALAGFVVWEMRQWRESIVLDLSTPKAQADWNQWRAEAAKDDGKHSPVQRAVPKSSEPPTLILMRDYFPACLIGLLIPLSALYAFIAWLVCGVLRPATPEIHGRDAAKNE
jgi:hypothetical protein